jgi:hypothetical protein
MNHGGERRTAWRFTHVYFYSADYRFADRTGWSVTDLAAQPVLGILSQWRFGISLTDRHCAFPDGPHLDPAEIVGQDLL